MSVCALVGSIASGQPPPKKPPLIAQILDPYEGTPDKFVLKKPSLSAKILDWYEVTQDEFAQIKYVLFAHIDAYES